MASAGRRGDAVPLAHSPTEEELLPARTEDGLEGGDGEVQGLLRSPPTASRREAPSPCWRFCWPGGALFAVAGAVAFVLLWRRTPGDSDMRTSAAVGRGRTEVGLDAVFDVGNLAWYGDDGQSCLVVDMQANAPVLGMKTCEDVHQNHFILPKEFGMIRWSLHPETCLRPSSRDLVGFLLTLSPCNEEAEDMQFVIPPGGKGRVGLQRFPQWCLAADSLGRPDIRLERCAPGDMLPGRMVWEISIVPAEEVWVTTYTSTITSTSTRTRTSTTQTESTTTTTTVTTTTATTTTRTATTTTVTSTSTTATSTRTRTRTETRTRTATSTTRTRSTTTGTRTRTRTTTTTATRTRTSTSTATVTTSTRTRTRTRTGTTTTKTRTTTKPSTTGAATRTRTATRTSTTHTTTIPTTRTRTRTGTRTKTSTRTGTTSRSRTTTSRTATKTSTSSTKTRTTTRTVTTTTVTTKTATATTTTDTTTTVTTTYTPPLRVAPVPDNAENGTGPCWAELRGHSSARGWWSAGFRGGTYNGSMFQEVAEDNSADELRVAGKCDVTLYGNPDFSGWAATFPAGRYDSEAMAWQGARINDTSAIRVAWPQPVHEGVAIPIFTADTRITARFPEVRGIPGKHLNNAGAGKPWTGWSAKVGAFQEAMLAEAVHNPQQLIILMDDDVYYGGCTDDELIDRYHRVVAASGGAQVVVSADPHQYPHMNNTIERFHEFEGRREAVMQAFGKPADALYNFTERPSREHDYFFVNSGFLMGPASYLLEVVNCMAAQGWDTDCLAAPSCWFGSEGMGAECCFDDQRGLSRCFLDRPDLITVDYAGSMIFTTFGMYNVFDIMDNRTVRNNLLEVTQCFIHGNCADCSQEYDWPRWLHKLQVDFQETAQFSV